MDEETTTRPPLVLFGRYGTNGHCAKADDGSHRLFPVDMSERRAKKKSGKKLQLPYSRRKQENARTTEETDSPQAG